MSSRQSAAPRDLAKSLERRYSSGKLKFPSSQPTLIPRRPSAGSLSALGMTPSRFLSHTDLTNLTKRTCCARAPLRDVNTRQSRQRGRSDAQKICEIREICVKLIIRVRSFSRGPSPLPHREGWGGSPYSITSLEMRFSLKSLASSFLRRTSGMKRRLQPLIIAEGENSSLAMVSAL